MSSNISRKAILINAPSSGKRLLPGSISDVNNYKNFLLSNRGGAWDEPQIKVLNNPSKQQVLDLVHSTEVHYNSIYFSGHGGTTPMNERLSSCAGRSCSRRGWPWNGWKSSAAHAIPQSTSTCAMAKASGSAPASR